jgi:anti-sigma factor RsiW
MRELPNEAILMRYLLGDLPDEDKAQIESQYFTDDELFELLLALEDELRERYLKGKLSTKDKKLFETKYGTTPTMRNRLAFSKVILQHFGERTEAAVRQTSSWEHLVVDFLSVRSAFKFAIAFSIAAAIAATWFAVETINEKRQLESERVTLQQKEKALQQQLSDEQSRAKDLAENLEAERTQAKLPVISFVLSPGGMRDVGSEQKIVLPKTPAVVVFRLDIEAVQQRDTYDAVLYDERIGIVKRWEGVQSVRSATGLQLTLSLQSRLLEARRYKIELVGKRGRLEYAFGVVGR